MLKNFLLAKIGCLSKIADIFAKSEYVSYIVSMIVMHIRLFLCWGRRLPQTIVEGYEVVICIYGYPTEEALEHSQWSDQLWLSNDGSDSIKGKNQGSCQKLVALVSRYARGGKGFSKDNEAIRG